MRARTRLASVTASHLGVPHYEKCISVVYANMLLEDPEQTEKPS